MEGAKSVGTEAIDWVTKKLTGLYNYLVPEEVREKISAFFKAFDLDGWDIVLAAVFPALEAVTLAIRAIGYAASDAVQPVDLFQDGISNATKTKVEPFVQQLRTLDDAIKPLIGETILSSKRMLTALHKRSRRSEKQSSLSWMPITTRRLPI